MSHGAGDIGDWKRLFEDLPVMYVLTREEAGRAHIDACNQRFVDTLGYDRSAVVGSPLTDVYTPDSATVHEHGECRRARGEEYATAQRQLVRADGTVVDTLMRAAPRSADGDDDPDGSRLLFVDVTARQQRRRQADVLGRLLRHNLRNDLTVLLNNASLLVEDADDDRTRQSARCILDTVRRWERIVEKAQRIRQVVSNDTSWAQTDLGPVLDRVEDDFEQRYPDATVRVLRPSGTATIRPEVELALTELCENAVEHGSMSPALPPRDAGGLADDPPEVVVTVSAPADDPWVTLTVADDGPAIPEPELLPLRDDETTPLLHSSGLGLWMVRLAVDRVGGDVSVLENDDSGTTIELKYPR